MSKPNTTDALKGVAKQATKQAANKAAKKLAKKVIVDVVVSTAPTWVPVVGIIVLLGLVIMTVTTLMGGAIGANEQASRQVVTAAGISVQDQAIYQKAGSEANIPWTLLPAIVKEQGSRGSGDTTHVGKFQLQITDSFTAADANDLKKSAQYTARKIRAELVKARADTYGQNVFVLAGAFTSRNSMAIPTLNAQAVRDATKMKSIFVKVLSALPITDPNQTWSGQVYDDALAWALGQTAQCASTSGTVGVANSPVDTVGALGTLNSGQATHALAIYKAAASANMGDRGAVIGIAVALAASNLLNYANDGTSQNTGYFPEARQLNAQERSIAKQSLNYAHDAVGNSLDSMGVFLERPSTNWGDPASLMDPQSAATLFFQRLTAVPGWKTTSKPWLAAQAVQGSPSSDGSIYQDQYALATTTVGLLKAEQGAPAATVTSTASGTYPSTGPPANSSGTASFSSPYPLPATTGTTGQEEDVDSSGRVASTGGAVTFAHFAALGDPYRKFYINMRWDYAHWNFNGTSTGIDQTQMDWFSTGANGKPRLVLVTNPRTGKSIIADVMESGPAPWVGVTSTSMSTDSTGIWTNPTVGTPAGYTGIVSGMPPSAIAALGAATGYVGQSGDQLIYQWAPDQNAIPGPSTLIATATGAAGSTGGSCTPCPTGNGVGSGIDVGGPASLGQWSPEQMIIAKQIATVALARALGERGVLIGIATGIAESTLTNVNHGDASGPSSIGVFQQMPPWGPNRTDPGAAAGYFYDRMAQVPGWQTLDPWIVAQTVQQSEFVAGFTGSGSDGTEGYNYRKVLPDAQAITTAIMTATPPSPGGTATGTAAANPTGTSGSSAPTTGVTTPAVPAPVQNASCTTGGGGAVVANGPLITIPSGSKDIPQNLWGKVLHTPNAAVAKGLAAGLDAANRQVPYVWGGGGDGSSHPDESMDDGCARGGGSENSCKGIIGYDCSGLTGFIMYTAGFGPIPGNSGAQRSGGTPIPYAQALPGDIIGYDGHVSMYLGVITGSGSSSPYLMEAPQVGEDVSVRNVYPDNYGIPMDTSVHRYWH